MRSSTWGPHPCHMPWLSTTLQVTVCCGHCLERLPLVVHWPVPATHDVGCVTYPTFSATTGCQMVCMSIAGYRTGRQSTCGHRRLANNRPCSLQKELSAAQTLASYSSLYILLAEQCLLSFVEGETIQTLSNVHLRSDVPSGICCRAYRSSSVYNCMNNNVYHLT